MVTADAPCLSATAACLQSHHGNLEPENHNRVAHSLAPAGGVRGMCNEQIVCLKSLSFENNAVWILNELA